MLRGLEVVELTVDLATLVAAWEMLLAEVISSVLLLLLPLSRWLLKRRWFELVSGMVLEMLHQLLLGLVEMACSLHLGLLLLKHHT